LAGPAGADAVQTPSDAPLAFTQLPVQQSVSTAHASAG
jgi:hypothetical protein